MYHVCACKRNCAITARLLLRHPKSAGAQGRQLEPLQRSMATIRMPMRYGLKPYCLLKNRYLILWKSGRLNRNLWESAHCAIEIAHASVLRKLR
eukprot:1412107-Prymnesium_polylepis.3